MENPSASDKLAAFVALCPEGVLLGLDVGTKTIGVAASDGLCMIATPQSTITRSKWAADKAALLEIITSRECVGLVVGYPVNMDGSLGPRAQSARDFAKRTETELRLPTLLWDERLSTAAVERMMIDADLSRQRRDVLVDKLAAAYILQGALDALASYKKSR